jgi:hypothetical protein
VEGRRIKERLQSPVRGTKTGQADTKLMGAFGLIRFKHNSSVVDNLRDCGAKDSSEGCTAALAAFDIGLLGLGGHDFGARLWGFQEQPITPLRLGHGRQMHFLSDKKVL